MTTFSQFAYKAKRGTEDAVACLLHSHPQNLESAIKFTRLYAWTPPAARVDTATSSTFNTGALRLCPELLPVYLLHQ